MTVAAPASASAWRRLHPLTIVREIGSMAWAIVAALVWDFDSIPEVPLIPEGVDLDAVVAVGVFAYAVVRYLFTAYRITDQTVDLRGGVFVKRSQSMPRERIQTVAAITPLIGRFLGVTTVEISAADAEDIRLSYVSSASADHLRKVLESGRKGAGEPSDPGDRRLLASLDPGGLVLFVLTEGGFALAVFALFIGIAVSVISGVLIAPLATAAVLAAWPVTRALGLVGFRSWSDGERLAIEAGLLSRKESEAPLARIQSIGVLRPPFRRLLGYETVEVVTGDPTVSKESVATSGTVAPLVPTGTWLALAGELIGSPPFGEPDLQPSSRHTIRRTTIRGLLVAALPVGVSVAGAVWWVVPAWVPITVGLVAVVGSFAYARARFRILGWVADDDYLMVRRGVFSRRLQVVPIGKVQNAVVVETPFQRRLGIATVEVDTAGTAWAAVKAIDLARQDARSLADHLVVTAAVIALPDGV